MGVADDQVAVVGHAQAAGPAVAVVGRGPGGAEVLAVAVIDLDAGGEIDDEQSVLLVDCDGAGADEVAVLDAAGAPDQFRLAAGAAAGEGEQAEADGGEDGQDREEVDGAFEDSEGAHQKSAYQAEGRDQTGRFPRARSCEFPIGYQFRAASARGE